MRTTVDLPDDVHDAARSIARDRGATLSETITELVRRGLGQGTAMQFGVSSATGLPTVTIGRTITQDDVRSLDDDE